MVKLGNFTVIDQNDQVLLELDPHDLEYLLELPEVERLGHIVSLNRTPRYGNRLNAFALLERLRTATEELPGRS
ncbi:MAG: hypothetical protein JNL05_03075 [Flavobacteriales bacterium]|nr:hypothetical protein [Flavobacteriales bacterium]